MEKFKKALVVSDTHHNQESLKQIANQYANVDYLFHLGDNTSDAHYLQQHLPGVEVHYVKGNCDLGSNAPEFDEVFVLGNKIILTHGHLLQVKYSYDRAYYYAQEQEAKALLFGHTHTAYTEHIDGLWLINPGSAGEATHEEPSVAMLVISKDGVVPKILRL